MITNSFTVGTRFEYDGRCHEVMGLREGDEVIVEIPETEERIRVKRDDLVEAYYRGDIVFEDEHAPQELPTQATHWGDIPNDLREVAERRLEVIEPFVRLRGSERRQAIVAWCNSPPKIPNEHSGTAPQRFSVATVYNWLKLYRDSGHDVRALVPRTKRRSGTETRLGDEVEELIRSSIKSHSHFKSRPGIERVYLDVLDQINRKNAGRSDDDRLRCPSRATVARRIVKYDPDGSVRRVRRRTPPRIHQASSTRKLLPLEIAEIDHTILDLIVIDEETGLSLDRPTFTLCIDVASRLPLGYYIGFLKPSYEAVLECLFHSMLPKTDACSRYGTVNQWLAYGVPSKLVVDNGREFIGKDLDDACRQLGIMQEISPVGTPQHKPHVERLYRTINDYLIHSTPGTTGSNPQHRGEYDSEGQAIYTLDRLHQAIHIFLVDIYAQRTHRSLEMTPAAAWESYMSDGIRRELAPRPQELAILLSKSKTRVIHPHGVELYNQQYWAEELRPLRKRLKRERGSASVKVRIHPGDMGRVYVYDEFNATYIPAQSRNPRMDGVSLSYYKKLREVLKEEQRQQDDPALASADARLRRQEKQAKKSKKMKTRSTAAREDERRQLPSRAALAPTREDGARDVSFPQKPSKGQSFLDSADVDAKREDYLGKEQQIDFNDFDEDYFNQ